MDVNSILFRCSALGQIMTGPQSKEAKQNGELGETCKKYLRQLYREVRYGRRKEVTTKFMEKGLMVEEDSITLYSRLHKRFFKKNERQLTNDYICGHPDLFIGLEIAQAEHITDTKSSWDLFTFPFPGDPLNKDYYWQLQGYMALSGAQSGSVAYCLVNTPETLINDEKRKLFYRMNAGTEENKSYLEACEELEKNMRFDDIHMEERLIEYHIERSEEDIEKIYERVRKCREYLRQLDESYSHLKHAA